MMTHQYMNPKISPVILGLVLSLKMGISSIEAMDTPDVAPYAKAIQEQNRPLYFGVSSIPAPTYIQQPLFNYTTQNYANQSYVPPVYQSSGRMMQTQSLVSQATQFYPSNNFQSNPVNPGWNHPFQEMSPPSTYPLMTPQNPPQFQSYAPPSNIQRDHSQPMELDSSSRGNKRKSEATLQNSPKKTKIDYKVAVSNTSFKNVSTLQELVIAINKAPNSEIFGLSISDKDVTIGFYYFEALIEKMNKVRGNATEKEAKKLVYKAIGYRIFDRIQKNEIEFPYRVQSDKKALNAFKELCDYKGEANILDKDKYNLTMDSYFTRFCRQGTDASGYYMDKNRLDTKINTKKASPLGLFKDRELLATEIAICSLQWKYNKNKKAVDRADKQVFDIGTLRFTLIRNHSASQYYPKSVIDTIKIITENFQTPITHVVDLCMGWGDRLVGFLATESITRIVGTDPSKDLHEGYTNIYNAYKSHTKQTTDLHLHKLPLEDLTAEQLCPNGVKSKLMLTSPPYFDYEKYDEKDYQSYKRYPNYDLWKEHFLKAMIVQSVYAVDLYGFVAINVGEISEHGKIKHNLPKDLELIAETYPQWISSFKYNWMESNKTVDWRLYPQYNMYSPIDQPDKLQKITDIFYNKYPNKSDKKDKKGNNSEESMGTVTQLYRLVPLNEPLFTTPLVGTEFIKETKGNKKSQTQARKQKVVVQ